MPRVARADATGALPMSTLKFDGRPLLFIGFDDTENALYQQLLTGYGRDFPSILTAPDITQALEIIRDTAPCCCILDDTAAGPVGLSPLARLRQEFAAENLPVVVLMAKENEEQSYSLLQQGAQDYLIKSEATAPRLYGALRNAIHTSHLQNQLTHFAHYDVLTGLLNRNLLYNRLAHTIGRCNRYNLECALVVIDIDSFKPFNEIYGYEVGDQILQHVATCIRNNCRHTDSPARMGSDEFMVLLEQVNEQVSQQITEKIITAIQAPFEVSGLQISLTASAGIANYPLAASVEEMLKHADEALFLAKRDQQVNFVNFSKQHKITWTRQQLLERELAKAIQQGDLALVYQPIVTASDYTLKRFEALSRWPRNDFAVSAPELIAMIDRLNLIEPFHDWLFQTAFGQIQAWNKELIVADVCLNIPANYCYSHSIARTIEQALVRFNIPPDKVELEITESTLMLYPERSVELLQGLHNKGLKIAVDDFGTGYSSMAYLTQLPLDTLKIDKQFFLDNAKNERNRKVIEAVTALGHSLGLEIIAEGVETQAELELAKQVGCDLLQGFYFGRPQMAGGDWNSYFKHFSNIILPSK